MGRGKARQGKGAAKQILTAGVHCLLYMLLQKTIHAHTRHDRPGLG